MSSIRIIESNDYVEVFLEKQENWINLVVRDVGLDVILKKWKININTNGWTLTNYQPSDEDYYKYEYVNYPNRWESMDDMLSDFQELTNNFTYFFNFPKE